MRPFIKESEDNDFSPVAAFALLKRIMYAQMMIDAIDQKLREGLCAGNEGLDDNDRNYLNSFKHYYLCDQAERYAIMAFTDGCKLIDEPLFQECLHQVNEFNSPLYPPLSYNYETFLAAADPNKCLTEAEKANKQALYQNLQEISNSQDYQGFKQRYASLSSKDQQKAFVKKADEATGTPASAYKQFKAQTYSLDKLENDFKKAIKAATTKAKKSTDKTSTLNPHVIKRSNRFSNEALPAHPLNLADFMHTMSPLIDSHKDSCDNWQKGKHELADGHHVTPGYFGLTTPANRTQIAKIEYTGPGTISLNGINLENGVRCYVCLSEKFNKYVVKLGGAPDDTPTIKIKRKEDAPSFLEGEEPPEVTFKKITLEQKNMNQATPELDDHSAQHFELDTNLNRTQRWEGCEEQKAGFTTSRLSVIVNGKDHNKVDMIPFDKVVFGYPQLLESVADYNAAVKNVNNLRDHTASNTIYEEQKTRCKLFSAKTLSSIMNDTTYPPLTRLAAYYTLRSSDDSEYQGNLARMFSCCSSHKSRTAKKEAADLLALTIAGEPYPPSFRQNPTILAKALNDRGSRLAKLCQSLGYTATTDQHDDLIITNEAFALRGVRITF